MRISFRKLAVFLIRLSDIRNLFFLCFSTLFLSFSRPGFELFGTDSVFFFAGLEYAGYFSITFSWYTSQGVGVGGYFSIIT